MKRKDIPKGTTIDHRDSNSKQFVWLLAGGHRLLYGIGRLVAEHNIDFGTFCYRWKAAGKPDEVPFSMLSPSGEGYGKKLKGWTVSGTWFPSLRSVATFMGRASSTIEERFRELGRRYATFEELAARKPRATPHQRAVQTVLCPDGNNYTFKELEEITGICASQLRRRAIEKGFVFGPHDLQRVEAIKAEPGKIKPVDPVYMTPRYRHIKLGDLCHLSGKKNTGAGKGEIPDEVWVKSSNLR